MALKATCSNCGTSFAMKNRDLEGKKVKCKSCGEPFVVSFKSGSGNSGGGMAAPTGLPPKTVGQKPPRKVKSPDAEDEPAKSETGSGNMKYVIIGGSILGALLIWTGIMFAIGSNGGDGSKASETVELELQHGVSEQGRIGVDYPKGWEFKTGGGTGGMPEFIRINGEDEDISISIKTNLKASAVGDIAGAGDQGEELPEELEPIAAVHEVMKSNVEANMNSYDEEPPEKIMARAGNSRLSKFVGDRGMLSGGKVWGYRATMPSGPDKLVVIINCESERLFNKYEPTLRKIVMSIGGPKN